ncbi:MAG: DegT/DnrJ/EryC1/StrS family aminotransferase [Campylobacterota bacterium]|nr:DegT/DnrJ/EryC1/StrS family aminotransferase [Campylobacterota bacterium]
MRVPFLDLKLQYTEAKKEIDEEILDVLESQQFVLGKKVEQLEKRVADYCGCKYAIGVSSGSDALLISLLSLNLKKGDEVITTPFTFISTTSAIIHAGLKPVFVDIDESYNIDVEKIEDAISKKTRVIIPVHLFGQCAKMKEILQLKEKYNLKIIEDSAQAIGAEYPLNGKIKKTCSMGDMGCLSFYPTKNLGGFGDGGMIISNNAETYKEIKMLRTHGYDGKHYRILGWNFRLNTLQAAVLLAKMNFLDKWNKMRQENARYYENLFYESGLLEKEVVKLPPALYREKVKNYHIYHQFVIRVKERDALRKFLYDKGIETGIYYSSPLHLQPCFSSLGYHKGDLPVTEQVCQEVLALTIYPGLKQEMQNCIVEEIKDFYK